MQMSQVRKRQNLSNLNCECNVREGNDNLSFENNDVDQTDFFSKQQKLGPRKY